MNTFAIAVSLLGLAAVLYFVFQPREDRKIGDWRSLFRYSSYHRGYLVGIGMGLLLSLSLRDSGWFFPVMLACVFAGSMIPRSAGSSTEVPPKGQPDAGGNSR